MRVALVQGWFGYVLNDGVEHGSDVVGGFTPVEAHPALLGRAKHGGEVELVFGSIEVAHEFKHLFLNLVGAAVGFVHFVDDHNGFQTNLNGFLEHETRLRHGTLESVDQQQAAVGQVEHTLHLAAKVAMPWSVDDVDLVTVIVDRNVLGENGDASLALKIIAVKDLSAYYLVVAEEVTCCQHLVDERGFAVVDMCDNCYVSNFLHTLNEFWVQSYTFYSFYTSRRFLVLQVVQQLAKLEG